MLGKDLSEALADISDDKIQDAAFAYQHSRRNRQIWQRVAAVAATLAILLTAALWPRKTAEGDIVTAPGVLRAYAYEMKGSEIVDLTEMEGMEFVDGSIPNYKAVFCPIMSVAKGIVITPIIAEQSLKEAKISIEVTANYGELYGDYYSEKYTGSKEDAFLGKNTIIGSGETIYWEGYEVLHASTNDSGIREKVYVDLIIKADGNIVGYAVMEMVPWPNEENMMGFAGQMKHSVFFPKVDGEFQNITEEYVEQQIIKFREK